MEEPRAEGEEEEEGGRGRAREEKSPVEEGEEKRDLRREEEVREVVVRWREAMIGEKGAKSRLNVEREGGRSS